MLFSSSESRNYHSSEGAVMPKSIKYPLAAAIFVCVGALMHEAIYAYLVFLMQTDPDPASWGTNVEQNFQMTSGVIGMIISFPVTPWLVGFIDDIVRGRRNKIAARAQEAERLDIESKWAALLPDLQKKN